MKKYFFVLLLILQNVIAQDELSETEKFATTVKVWGFLKYYHPNVSEGKFNWDKQFIDILPKVQGVKSIEDLSKVYLEWINSLGNIKETTINEKVLNKAIFNKNFNLSWTQDTTIFSKELCEKLKFVEENRNQKSNFYVKKTKNGNIEIINENKYKNYEYPEKDYRLLSLSRYWNTIEYFFPYKYLMDQKWDVVLSEMIPKFLNSKDATEYQLNLLETVVKIDDSHANLYSNKIHDYFGKKYIPAFFNLIENKVVITGYYNDSLAKINDIRIGDILEEIEGKDVLSILQLREKYVHGSNKNTKAINYDFFAFNGSTDSINITIKRDSNKVINKKIGRYLENVFKLDLNSNQVKYKLLENNIGYINMATISFDDVEKMMDYLESSNGLIIDLRNYPKCGPFLIARRLIKQEKEFAKLIEPDLSYPGKFIWTKPVTIKPLKNKFYNGKVVILVNEETQSMAEYSAMLFQTGDNVTTIGSQTAGADGDISKIEFFGFTTFMSGIGIFYPDETETQRKGIKINMYVKPSIKGIQEQKDEVLEQAIEFLNKKSN
jgi:carboxyl-terminal processing protease